MKQILEKNGKGIIMMMISALIVCIGQLMWKLYATNQNYIFLLQGFFLYGIGALIMIKAYVFGSLSVLQPVLCSNYIFAMVIGFFVLHETINIFKLIGVLIIIIGIYMLALGDEE